MIEVFFQVKADLNQGELLRIVGSLQIFGNWNVQSSIILHHNRNRWESGPVSIQSNKSFEFKIIKQSENKVQWQNLPKNSNRKFKSKKSIKLHLNWNMSEGRVSKISRQKTKKDHLHHNSSDQKTSVKLIRYDKFDPYTNAYYSNSSDEEQQDLVIRKRKISDWLSTTNIDFQELFYRTQPFEILCSLMKKNKIYLISKEINLQNRFHKEIEGRIKEMNQYFTKWMTYENLKNENRTKNKSNIQSVDTLFEIDEEEMLNQNLHSKTSYFIILDVESAIALKAQLLVMPTCIFLSSTEFQVAKQRVNQLPKVQLICFDRQEQNKKFCQFLEESNISLFQNSHAKLLCKQVPTLKELALILQCYKKKNNVVINKRGTLKQEIAIESMMKPNTLTFVEGGMIGRCGDFIQKLIKRKQEKSLIVFVIKQDQLTHKVIKFKGYKNVVIIYNGFKNIVISNSQYHPLRKFHQTIDMFRMKAKLLCELNGGNIIEKHNSLSYIIPDNKIEMAAKVFSGFKETAKSHSFIKVTRRGKKIKTVWNISQEARAMRTLCQIKYTSFGQLGSFNIISDNLSLREFQETFKLLVDHYPKLFEQPKNTKVDYYSYGGKVMATCHILPQIESESQDQ